MWCTNLYSENLKLHSFLIILHVPYSVTQVTWFLSYTSFSIPPKNVHLKALLYELWKFPFWALYFLIQTMWYIIRVLSDLRKKILFWWQACRASSHLGRREWDKRTLKRPCGDIHHGNTGYEECMGGIQNLMSNEKLIIRRQRILLFS